MTTRERPGLLDLLRWAFKPRKVPWVCEFSEKYPDWDAHDYHKEAGGDGYPNPMHEVACWHCGRKFSI